MVAIVCLKDVAVSNFAFTQKPSHFVPCWSPSQQAPSNGDYLEVGIDTARGKDSISNFWENGRQLLGDHVVLEIHADPR